jgi:hypothetical protein
MQWPGTGTYFVPPLANEVRAVITGPCSVGWCKACSEPPGAFVRVVSTKLVEVWAREVESTAVAAHIDADHEKAYFDAEIEASRLPYATASSSDPAEFYFIYERPNQQHPPVNRISIRWNPVHRTYPMPRKEMQWTLKATIYGVCPSGAPCMAPADEYVRITNIVPKPKD